MLLKTAAKHPKFSSSVVFMSRRLSLNLPDDLLIIEYNIVNKENTIQ